MPPHCDSMDGPVVKAAIKALEASNVNLILPYVPKDGENEVINAYNKVIELRKQNEEAKYIADQYFFEIVVRIHRAGEGAPFTGLKPAGLDHGPVVPVAEEAIETGNAEKLIKLLSDALKSEIEKKFAKVIELKKQEIGPVDKAREYVSNMLGFIVNSHKLYECITADTHHFVHQHED
jgi:hypothetical protein